VIESSDLKSAYVFTNRGFESPPYAPPHFSHGESIAALLRPSKFAVDPEASRVNVPALLIWGKNDQFASEAMARESLQYCDDGHLEMFETATHWVQHEQPARVNNLLSQFFA
jgi:pimeloyl-ACP methyl ester carboxylesterase